MSPSRARADARARLPSPRLVAVTAGRVDATSGWRRTVADPVGDGWVDLDARLDDPAGFDAWVATELAGTAGGHPDLAGALIVYRLAGSLAEVVVGALVGQRRALALTPATVALRFGDAARIEAIGVRGTSVAVLDSDPQSDDPAARPVGSVADLRTVAARGLVDVFAPVVDAVRARAPFGRRGMWGTLADHVAEVAVRRARDGGDDLDEAWNEASALLDVVAGSVDQAFTRPRREVVPSRRGPQPVVAKGTCCLIYKSGAPVGDRGAAANRVGPDACTSCPLRPDADRARRFTAWLDAT